MIPNTFLAIALSVLFSGCITSNHKANPSSDSKVILYLNNCDGPIMLGPQLSNKFHAMLDIGSYNVNGRAPKELKGVFIANNQEYLWYGNCVALLTNSEMYLYVGEILNFLDSQIIVVKPDNAEKAQNLIDKLDNTIFPTESQ